jgi:type I restriction enzyme S subunit
MSEWKEYKLVDVAEIFTGYPFPGGRYEANGKLRVVRGENVTIGKLRWDTVKHWNYDVFGLEKYLLRPDDIVIGMDGSRVGSNRALIRELDLPLIIAQRVACLRVKRGFNPKYIWYTIFTDTFRKYVEAINTGTSIPHISQKQIADFEIMCPGELEQKRIAGVLSSLDDKIDLLNRENATLEALAETLFRHYFIENPNPAWKEGKLGELIEVKYGKDHKKLGDGSIPVIGSGGIMRYANKALFDGESVLIPRKGSLDNVMYIDEPFWTVDTMFYTKMKIPHVAKFVYQYMKTLDLVNMNVGSAVPSMTADVLNNILLEIPSQTTLDDYERIVTPFYKKTKSNQQQMQTLTTQRDALLPRLMSGEVKVGGQ